MDHVMVSLEMDEGGARVCSSSPREDFWVFDGWWATGRAAELKGEVAIRVGKRTAVEIS
jgi:hypothetical protein